jgi:hypothetical protein
MSKAKGSARGSYTPLNMKSYEALDEQWRKIGLSAPARKALVDAKLYKVSDLRKLTLSELTELSGISSSALARIRQIMTAKKISFRA